MKRLLAALGVAALALVGTGFGAAGATTRAAAVTFGGPCDGHTNVTSAMQNAINSAAKAKVPLQLPTGTCVITPTLRMPSNTDIVGQGFGSVLKFNADATFMSTAGNGESNITLTKFSALGSGNGQPAGLGHNNSPGIHINDAKNVTINGVQVAYDTGVAITLLSDQNVLVENNAVHNSGRDGITAFETGTQRVQNYTVQNNVIGFVGDDAIAVDLPQSSSAPPPLATGVKITGNMINGWGSLGTKPNPNGKQLGRGIALNGVAGVVATGNAINWTYSAGVMLSGCTVGWCGSSFAQHPSTLVQVTGNTITNAGQDFPFSNQGQGGQPTYGFYVYNAKAPVDISGNTVTHPLSGVVKIGNPGCSGGCTVQAK